MLGILDLDFFSSPTTTPPVLNHSPSLLACLSRDPSFCFSHHLQCLTGSCSSKLVGTLQSKHVQGMLWHVYSLCFTAHSCVTEVPRTISHIKMVIHHQCRRRCAIQDKNLPPILNALEVWDFCHSHLILKVTVHLSPRFSLLTTYTSIPPKQGAGGWGVRQGTREKGDTRHGSVWLGDTSLHGWRYRQGRQSTLWKGKSTHSPVTIVEDLWHCKS